MSSSKSKELKARKKLEKAFVQWFMARLETNTMEAKEKIRSKMTSEEWEQLNSAVNEIADEMREELKRNPNASLGLISKKFLHKIQREPMYEQLVNKFEYKMLKEGLRRARKRKTDYIT